MIISPDKQPCHKNDDKIHRIFFALWPDDATRIKIVESFKQLSIDKTQGRIVNFDNVHITLHFVGNVNQQKWDCLHRAAQKVQADGFNLDLDHYGYFNKPKILWMGLKQTPEALETLHKTLGESLAECDFQVERRPYAPHMTLMRKPAQPEAFEKTKPIFWQVKTFVLVESISIEGGVRYEVRERYALR